MNYQQAIVYINHINETERLYRNRSWDSPVEINSVANMISLNYQFIPIAENVIYLDNLKQFYLSNKCPYNSPADWMYNFTDFICDGMSLQTAKENIVSLYQNQINGVVDFTDFICG